MTFPQWRGQLRLQHATLLLATGSTVTGAGAANGYANTSAFIAAFGVTPAAYRNQTV
jgi:AraC-like DNA-binding protein